jgi:integrase/recombinase XerD
MSAQWRRVFDAAGIKDARSHSGRRSYLTKLAQKGCSVFVLQQLAGHKSITTIQKYVMVNKAQLFESANLL